MACNRSSRDNPHNPRVPSVSDPAGALQPAPGADLPPLDELQQVEHKCLQRPGAGPSSAIEKLQIKSEGRVRAVAVKRAADSQVSSSGVDRSASDLGRGMQYSRSQNPVVVRRTPRVPHIRCWHASAEHTDDILQAAGEDSGPLTQELGDTCQPCEPWARTSASLAATGSTSQNAKPMFSIV